MRVLILDQQIVGLDLAARAVADGHDVRIFRPTIHPTGEGFEGVKIISDWRGSMGWVGRDGLVVNTDNKKYLMQLDRFLEFGFKIFGPTLQSAALEIDRAKGMKVMEGAGIEVPHYETFTDLKAAEAFARKADQAYVFKTLGSEDDKSLSYVSNSPADMVAWIRRQQARGLKLSGSCMLQEKIDMIAELGVSGWFGPEGFLPDKWQECFEHKKLCNGEIGPNTGEMGTVCQYAEKSKLAEMMLEPMAPILQALGHRGDFAIGCGIDSKGNAWPFEFTARTGFPAFPIQIASHKGDVCQWMRDLLDGKDSLKVDYRTAVGVVLAQPPWPRDDGEPECVEGNPISGVDEVWNQVHPVDMMIGKGPNMDGGKVVDGPQYQTTAELVCVVTGLGSTVSKAKKAAYTAVENVCFTDAIYRTDIGDKLEVCLPKLHRAGFSESVIYE